MSATSTATQWITGWTLDAPPRIDYSFIDASGKWGQGRWVGTEAFDLGLAAASDGKMSARHIRIARAQPAGSTDWEALDLDFHFLYVLKGSANIENTAGERVTLEPGATTCLPPFFRHRLLDVSPDFEILEVLVPAAPAVVKGKDATLPERAGYFAGQHPEYRFETADCYQQGAGPRRFFRYRDLNTRGPTQGRMHIHAIQAVEPMEGGTGWHKHTMSQLFWVTHGKAGFNIEGHGEIRQVVAGDAVCVAAGMRHNVPTFSPDYELIEMCIPADYDTIDTEPPKFEVSCDSKAPAG